MILGGLSAKRLMDIFIATSALLVFFPVILISALGVKVASPGPVFYFALRSGKNGIPFKMVKLRTMHVGSDRASAITAPKDERVFRFGSWLRKLKIDELPQFWNILVGDMSVVGPRPEDPKIVERDYADWMVETLAVAPGVTSPGAIYGYVYGEQLLDSADPEGSYARNLLPPKLALERAYLDRANFFSDLYYVFLTAWAICLLSSGMRVRLPTRDVVGAQTWCQHKDYFKGLE